MFVVDAAILLPHPAPAVMRVVARLHALPRWCAGLRRVRYPAPEVAADGVAGDGVAGDGVAGDGVAGDGVCVFTYAAVERRLTLRARTLDRVPGAPPTIVEHAAAGDGLTLTWTLAAEPDEDGTAGAPHGAVAGYPQTRLRARIAVAVDPDHPTAAARAALCRVIARRAPLDLERLRALLDRYEAGRPRADRIPPLPTADLASRPAVR